MDLPWMAANENGTVGFIDYFTADKGSGVNAEDTGALWEPRLSQMHQYSLDDISSLSRKIMVNIQPKEP